jgi:hypothetical protein
MAFKELVRDQFFMLLLDEGRAIEAIPAMLARDRENVLPTGRDLRRFFDVVGIWNDLSTARLAEMEAMFAAIDGGASDTGRSGEVVSASLRGRSSRRTRSPGTAAT